MGAITVRQALDEYEKIYVASRNFAQRTRVEYINDLEDLIQFLEQLGIREVKDIGLPQLERYLAELDHRGMAGSTRKRKVVSIRSFLGYLYQDRYITIDIAKRLIPPFAEAKSPRYLTKSEYERLLVACAHNPRDSAIIQLLLQTGIKLSELTKLNIGDIELPHVLQAEMKNVGYLHILGSERRKARILPLNYKACLALDTYFRRRSLKINPALFINRFGERLSGRGIEKIVNKYSKPVGIAGITTQALRHTFGMHQVMAGMSLKTIQDAMGNNDPRTTSLYFTLKNQEMDHEVKEHPL